MANPDLIITFLNGNTHVVHRDADTQVSQVRAELEQEIKVQDLMEIKLLCGSMILRDPLPEKIEGPIQGVISSSPTKALIAIQHYANAVHRMTDAVYIPKRALSPSSDDDSDGCPSLVSESSSDFGGCVHMDLIRPFNKTHKEGHMCIPSTPLSPEAELCMRALIIIEDDFETLAEPQEITRELLDLSSKLVLSSYRLNELPSWLELSINGIKILQSNIGRPGLAEQVRKYMHNGLYDVVKLACRSTRKAAAHFLIALAV